jgi:hypothetical protein
MPVQVPVYDNFRVGIERGGGARFDNSIGEAAATAPGRAIQSAGQQMSELAARVQGAIDEARVREADVLLSTELTALLNDPEQGFLSAKGKNAIDGFAEAEKRIEAARERASALLKTGRQQALFEAAAASRLNSARERISAHTMREADGYNASQAEAQLSTYANDAAASPFDIPLLASRAVLTRQTAARIAELRGLSPEAAELLQTKALTNYHGAVLDSLMARDRGAEAREYLARHESEIDATQMPKFRAAVKQAAIKAESTDLADSLIAQGGTEMQMLTKLRELYQAGEISAELRDATTQRVNYYAAQVRQAQTEERRAILGQVQEFFIRNPGAPPVALPAPLYAALKADGNLDAAMALSRATGGGGGGGGGAGDAESKAAVYTELAALRDVDPDAFQEQWKSVRADYIGRLTPNQLRALDKHIADGAFQDFTEGMATIKGELAAAGISMSPSVSTAKDKKTQEAAAERARVYARFQSAYMDALAKARRENKGELTSQQKRDIGLYLLGDAVLTTRHTETGWFGGERRMVTTATSPRFRAMTVSTLDEIPPITRRGIERDLAARGVAATTEQIIREYRRRAATEGAPDARR